MARLCRLWWVERRELAKNSADGGPECTTYSDCLPWRIYHQAGPACRNGRCEPCESDTDCGAGRCKEGRCYDCLVDKDCPLEEPWCDSYPESSALRCYECTVHHQCAPGAYCPLGGMFQQGGDCVTASCATAPDSNECKSCIFTRGRDNCPECDAARLDSENCTTSANARNCYYPDCCQAEYDASRVYPDKLHTSVVRPCDLVRPGDLHQEA